MGLLSKLADSQTATPAVASPPQIAPKEKPPATSATTPPIEGPAPVQRCAGCQGTKFWRDVYGRGPHCTTCFPPPAPSMVMQTMDTVQLARKFAEQPTAAPPLERRKPEPTAEGPPTWRPRPKKACQLDHNDPANWRDGSPETRRDADGRKIPWVRSTCRGCSGFIGYRPVKQAKEATA